MPKNGVSEEREIIYIPDDDGNEEAFEVLFTFELDENDHKYILVTPEEQVEGEAEVFAFRYEEEDDDKMALYFIEDEQEWDLVEETFNTLLAEFEQENGQFDEHGDNG